MWSLAILCTAVVLALAALALSARLRTARLELTAMMERVAELGARLESVEQTATRAAAQAETAENVLLEKGIADEEDIEAARQRRVGDGQPAYVRERDGALH